MTAVPPGALVPPGHPLWQVHRERVLLLGAGRALLMQLAHPLVAAGVAEHSDFTRDPLGRLRRTLGPMYAMVFGDAAARAAARRGLEAVHGRVRGRLAAAVGPFPAGAPYDAGDPALRAWVHATLVDSTLVAHARFVGPLAPAARSAYYAASRLLGREVGVPENALPATIEAFEAWMARSCAGDTLTVGPAARAAAAAVLRPRHPLLTPAMPLLRFVTAGLLPAPLRARYGLPWSPGRERLLEVLAAAVRGLRPALPAPLRVVAPARRAERAAVRARTVQPGAPSAARAHRP
jgi:uncharacterized protein (DUF2236 family)